MQEMNNRINELIEQANEYQYTIWDQYNQKEVEYYKFNKEKFAELIVQECLKCGDRLVTHYINTHTEQEQALLLAAIADYTSEIKQHYGL